MSKKLSMKVKTEKGLTPIEGVTDKEVQIAEKELLNAEERKKNRSSMINYLNQRGENSAYDNSGIQIRKAFMNEFKAWKTTDDATKREAKSSRLATSTKHTERTFDWMNKWELITKFGKESAEAKIESNTLEHQPEKSSGKDTEWIPPAPLIDPLRNAVRRVAAAYYMVETVYKNRTIKTNNN